jgi:hypothetical protein
VSSSWIVLLRTNPIHQIKRKNTEFEDPFFLS